jgi:hypothetical protein
LDQVCTKQNAFGASRRIFQARYQEKTAIKVLEKHGVKARKLTSKVIPLVSRKPFKLVFSFELERKKHGVFSRLPRMRDWVIFFVKETSLSYGTLFLIE